MGHFGWGWYGHSIDKVHTGPRFNPQRRNISAYCREYGVSRKVAKKQQRAIKRGKKNRRDLQRASRDARKAGRPFTLPLETPGARSQQHGGNDG